MSIKEKLQTGLRSFYPGSIWAKRIIRMTVVFAIGANVFINDFQEHALGLIDLQSKKISQITEEIDVEQYRLEKIENGSWTAYSMDWLSVFIDSPKANEVNQVIEFSDETLDNVKSINSRLGELDSGTTIAMQVLKYTSLFMWIPIGLSILWLSLDLYYGRAKLFVGLGLALAIPFGIGSYRWLCEAAGMVTV